MYQPLVKSHPLYVCTPGFRCHCICHSTPRSLSQKTTWPRFPLLTSLRLKNHYGHESLGWEISSCGTVKGVKCMATTLSRLLDPLAIILAASYCIHEPRCFLKYVLSLWTEFPKWRIRRMKYNYQELEHLARLLASLCDSWQRIHIFRCLQYPRLSSWENFPRTESRLHLSAMSTVARGLLSRRTSDTRDFHVLATVC